MGESLYGIMQSFGFSPYHKRPDRDLYVDVHWKNVDSGVYKEFLRAGNEFNLGKVH